MQPFLEVASALGSSDPHTRNTQAEKKRDEVEQGVATLKKETRFVMMSPVDKPPADTADEPAEPEPETPS